MSAGRTSFQVRAIAKAIIKIRPAQAKDQFLSVWDYLEYWIHLLSDGYIGRYDPGEEGGRYTSQRTGGSGLITALRPYPC
jgi:hypothetical protein